MRVVIAEDTAVLRVGLVQLLSEEGYEVVAAVADGEALKAAVAQLHPDVVVADIRMPPTHTDEGLRAVIDLRERDPNLKVQNNTQKNKTQNASHQQARRTTGVGYL